MTYPTHPGGDSSVHTLWWVRIVLQLWPNLILVHGYNLIKGLGHVRHEARNIYMFPVLNRWCPPFADLQVRIWTPLKSAVTLEAIVKLEAYIFNQWDRFFFSYSCIICADHSMRGGFTPIHTVKVLELWRNSGNKDSNNNNNSYNNNVFLSCLFLWTFKKLQNKSKERLIITS